MKKLRIILCIAFAIFVIPYIVSGLSWYILGERIYGCGGASILWDVGMTPDTIPWTLGGIPYYDSEIIYYAVGN